MLRLSAPSVRLDEAEEAPGGAGEEVEHFLGEATAHRGLARLLVAQAAVLGQAVVVEGGVGESDAGELHFAALDHVLVELAQALRLAVEDAVADGDGDGRLLLRERPGVDGLERAEDAFGDDDAPALVGNGDRADNSDVGQP